MNAIENPALKSVPKWLVWALLETYVSETPGVGSTQRVLDYFKLGKITLKPDDATAWCAIFANAALEAAGFNGTGSPMAMSFARSQSFTKLSGPALGAINVWERGAKGSGLGHVNFYTGETETLIYGVGGNQDDAVNISAYSRAGKSLRHVGYFWPVGVPVPEIKPVLLGNSPNYGGGSVV
jgi:uncharacterized protein (TIGR02594 family)